MCDDHDAGLGHPCPEGVEHGVAGGSGSLGGEHRRRECDDQSGALVDGPFELLAGPVGIGECHVGGGEDAVLVGEPPVLLEPPVEALVDGGDCLDVVTERFLVVHSGGGKHPAGVDALVVHERDPGVPVLVRSGERFEVGPHQLHECPPLGVALVVLAQHSWPGYGVEGRIGDLEVDLSAHHVALVAVLQGHPLHASTLHCLGNVTQEGVMRFVVVVVGVEHRNRGRGHRRAPIGCFGGWNVIPLP